MKIGDLVGLPHPNIWSANKKCSGCGRLLSKTVLNCEYMWRVEVLQYGTPARSPYILWMEEERLIPITEDDVILMMLGS